MVGGQLLEVSCGGELLEHLSLVSELPALEDHIFGCLRLPPAGAGRRLEAGDLAAVEEGCKANLASADLC